MLKNICSLNVVQLKCLEILIPIFLFIMPNTFVNAQQYDSLRTKHIIKKSILPVTFISAGLIINNSHFEKDIKINLRNIVGNNFEFPIDDYIQYAPIAQMYIANMFKIKAKNHWFDQTKYLLISNLLTSGITHGIKHITNKTRPNGSPYSFPSGHTTFAFTNATVLFNEFHETAPILGYSGYLFSTTTGVFRMLNNKHWLSDVLVGAGIGIAVTNLVYYFEPFKNFNPFKKSRNITFVPQINNNQYRLYFSYKF